MGTNEDLNEDRNQKEFMEELQRLLACYQIASRDDRNVVWSALNKYMPHINQI